MKTKTIIPLIAILILIMSCSSLPKSIPSPDKQNYDAFLTMAHRAEQNRNFAQAQEFYAKALNGYKLLADPNGVMEVYSGFARIALLQDIQPDFDTWYAKMQDMNVNLYSANCHYMVLIDLYRLHQLQSWKELNNYAIVKDDFPIVAKLQILSYKVQTNSLLGINDPDSWKQLVSAYYKAKKQQPKPASALSMEAYSIAYYFMAIKDYKKAERYIDQAIYYDYTSASYSSLATSLLLAATIAEKAGDMRTQRASLMRAKMIYEGLGDAKASQEIQQVLEGSE